MFWEDVNVVLLGTLDKGGLAEYLQGPHFQVEVHNRDRKIEYGKPNVAIFNSFNFICSFVLCVQLCV